MKDGEKIESASLSASNDWVHVWKDLPQFHEDGTEIGYTVEEEYVPHYTSNVEKILTNEVITSWSAVESLENGGQYMLTHGGQGLTVTSDGKLQWIDMVATTDDMEFSVWTAEASGSGFILRYGDYKLTLNGTSSFSASTGNGNQTIYYANDKKLYAVNGNKQYEFGQIADGTAVATENSGIGIELMKMNNDIIDVTYFKVTNTFVAYELPETGGHGTAMFTVSGLVVMAAAFLEMIRRRKRA